MMEMAGYARARLDVIAHEILDHLRCPSEPCATCAQLVPGAGSATAQVVIVGEAPGAAEDASGLPFVGNAGKLLDRLLEEAGLARAEQPAAVTLEHAPVDAGDPVALRGETAERVAAERHGATSSDFGSRLPGGRALTTFVTKTSRSITRPPPCTTPVCARR